MKITVIPAPWMTWGPIIFNGGRESERKKLSKNFGLGGGEFRGHPDLLSRTRQGTAVCTVRQPPRLQLRSEGLLICIAWLEFLLRNNFIYFFLLKNKLPKIMSQTVGVLE